MKFTGTAAATLGRILLTSGPSTAVALADHLGLTGAAVRKQLDSLIEAGLVEASERASYGPAALEGKRGRGRPSRVFSLTARGRNEFGEHADSLALAAVKFMGATNGIESVKQFAQQISNDFVARHHDITELASTEDRARALIDALNADGFAATETPGLGDSIQICQHNCPMGDVATEFPEVCEAETRAFSELTGVHVTRLATIAKGSAVCTTLVPHSRRESA